MYRVVVRNEIPRESLFPSRHLPAALDVIIIPPEVDKKFKTISVWYKNIAELTPTFFLLNQTAWAVEKFLIQTAYNGGASENKKKKKRKIFGACRAQGPLHSETLYVCVRAAGRARAAI